MIWIQRIRIHMFVSLKLSRNVLVPACGSCLQAAGFCMAAHAIVPLANLASFFVGPEPKNTLGSTLTKNIWLFGSLKKKQKKKNEIMLNLYNIKDWGAEKVAPVDFLVPQPCFKEYIFFGSTFP